jgi:hypothetical protein
MFNPIWSQTKVLKLKKEKIRKICYLILTGLFNFVKQILALIYILSHSCLPFLDFLGQVMNFYKYTCVNLIYTYFKFYKPFYMLCHIEVKPFILDINNDSFSLGCTCLTNLLNFEPRPIL